MSARHFIGIDPGPIPGIVFVHAFERTHELSSDVIQCTPKITPFLLWSLLSEWRTLLGDISPAIVQIERFVVGRGSMRSGAAGSITRDLIGRLQQEAQTTQNVTVVMRSAAEVKPWATDQRLEAVGLLDATKGMPHARDAARHALFCAVRDGGLPDPLSKRSK